MRLLIILLLVISSYGLSTEQKSNLKFSYKQGAKYGLGWTLAGISYVESKLGLYRVNLSDPSGSQYHILIKSVLNRNHIPNTSWNRSRVMEKLLDDKYFAARQAISELLYWKAYWIRKGYSGNWLWVKTVGSYNGGYYSNVEYVRKVARAIKMLKRKHLLLQLKEPKLKL